MENRTYLNHIETIRGLAALSVAIFHFTNYYNGQQFLLNSEKTRSLFVYGAQGVEMFYIISGFIISYSLFKSKYKIKHYFHYLGKRLSRLFPPYITTIFLIVLVSYGLTTFIWKGTYDLQIKNIIANSFFAVDFINSSDFLNTYFPDNAWINPIFKTLKVEFQFYLLIGLIFPLINRNRIVLLLFCFLFLGLGVYTRNMDTFLVNSPYFIIGIALFYVYENGWKWELTLLLLTCFSVLFYTYEWQDLIVSIITLFLLLGLPQKTRLLRLTGKISYSYYLIHGLTGGWFLYFTSETYLAINYPVVLIILALSISWAGAFLMYFCIEKPSLIISKKISYKP